MNNDICVHKSNDDKNNKSNNNDIMIKKLIKCIPTKSVSHLPVK